MPKRTFNRQYVLEVLELARTGGKSRAHLEREPGTQVRRRVKRG
jgi:hypothetical protein